MHATSTEQELHAPYAASVTGAEALALLESGQSADCVIAVISSIGFRYPAHKLILGNRSEFFAALFRASPPASDGPSAPETFWIDVPSPHAFRATLQLLYSGEAGEECGAHASGVLLNTAYLCGDMDAVCGELARFYIARGMDLLAVNGAAASCMCCPPFEADFMAKILAGMRAAGKGAAESVPLAARMTQISVSRGSSAAAITELQQAVQLHLSEERNLTVEDILAFDPSDVPHLPTAAIRPALHALKQELHALELKLRKAETIVRCARCHKQMTLYMLDKTCCVEYCHTGRYEVNRGWSCCKAARKRSEGCTFKTHKTHTR